MPVKLRLATFNIENLFTRHDFNAFLKGPNSREARYLAPIVKFMAEYGDGDIRDFEDFRQLVKVAAISQDDDKRQHTALALAALNADVVALQEVDSFDALRRFLSAYYAKTGETNYRHVVLHEGNDPRGIDVATISQSDWPVYSRSHADLTPAWIDNTATGEALLDEFPLAKTRAGQLSGKRIFRRDCVETVLTKTEQEVSIFNCHFKSMGGGRSKSMGMRQLEAITVREIINRKYDDPASALWAVIGDLNDYRQVIKVRAALDNNGNRIEEIDVPDESGVDPFIADGFGINLLERLPEFERWTHFYPAERHKTQLDYIIVSPALADKLVGEAEIIRLGMPHRVPNLDPNQRFPRVGWDRPKASDHCPVVAEFRI